LGLATLPELRIRVVSSPLEFDLKLTTCCDAEVSECISLRRSLSWSSEPFACSCRQLLFLTNCQLPTMSWAYELKEVVKAVRRRIIESFMVSEI
jgi:hypothetical protein